MFHSNQRLDVTAELKDVQVLVETAVRLSDDFSCLSRDNDPVIPAWRVTDNGKYFCIGTGNLENEPDGDLLDEGWTSFGFRYDPAKIADEIRKWIEKKGYPRSDCDGMTLPGARCQVFDASLTRMPGEGPGSEEEWDDYMSCIACFSPWTCEFEK